MTKRAWEIPNTSIPHEKTFKIRHGKFQMLLIPMKRSSNSGMGKHHTSKSPSSSLESKQKKHFPKIIGSSPKRHGKVLKVLFKTERKLGRGCPPVHRDIQYKSQRDEVYHHCRTTIANERKRDSGDRQQSDAHAHILDKMECVRTGEADNDI